MRPLFYAAVLSAMLAPLNPLSAAEQPEAAPDGIRTVSDPQSQVQSNCGFARTSDDYWFCLGLQNQNCSLTRNERSFWLCEGLITKNCDLIRGSADYWFCTGLLTDTCGLNRGSSDYWFCSALLERNCSLSRDRFWLCKALEKPIHAILANNRAQQAPPAARPLFF